MQFFHIAHSHDTSSKRICVLGTLPHKTHPYPLDHVTAMAMYATQVGIMQELNYMMRYTMPWSLAKHKTIYHPFAYEMGSSQTAQFNVVSMLTKKS